MSSTTCAILFDLDGTLLDTAPEFTHCLNILLQQEAKPQVVVEQLREVVSFGVKGMIEFGFKIREQDPQFESLKNRMLEAYRNNLGSLTQFFPGVLELLSLLEEKKIPWGIVTNKPTIYTLGLIEKFKALSHAHCVIAGDTLATQKPDPAPLLFACQTLKVTPQSCWYIGDAKTDLIASHLAGMRCAIANYGYIPVNEDPKTWQAACYLNHANQIQGLLA